jgi:hypothetical protein
LQPFVDVLIPHLANEFPDVWQRILVDWPNTDHERDDLAKVAELEPRPIQDILAEVEKN